MKVGITTTHTHQNFGTFLQCYALQRIISEFGGDAEIIDYRRKDYSRPSLEKIRIEIGYYRKHPIDLFKWVLASRLIHKRQVLFNSFAKKYFNLSASHYNTTDDILASPPCYDIYLTGSDQVWNPSLGGFILPYFLSFAPESKKRASYAPSIGLSQLTEKEGKELTTLLNRFSHISCREISGCDLLKSYGINDVIHVLDPTLLIDTQVWEQFSRQSDHLTKKYNLCYFLDDSEEKRRKVKNFWETTNNLVFLTTDYRYQKGSILAAGPIDFLSLIRNAESIITDSYHGMLFCMIFHRDFYMFPRNNPFPKAAQNSRITDFLSDLGLFDRWNPRSLTDCKTIDYEIIDKLLNDKKNKSLQFIQSIFDSCK